MTNIDRAAEIIAEAGAYCGECCFGECGMPDCPRDADWRACPDCAAAVTGYARALADAGLLTQEPQIIRTREELAALDPSTVVTNGPLIQAAVTAVPFHKIGVFPLPAVVIATGDQVRAARQALEDDQ